MDPEIHEKASYMANLHLKKLATNEMDKFNIKYKNQFIPKNKSLEYRDNISFIYTDKNNCVYERPKNDYNFDFQQTITSLNNKNIFNISTKSK